MAGLRTPLCALALTGLMVAPVAADHDTPRAAKSIKADLVRAYAECAAPNDVHDQVTVFASACSPAAPLSSYRFGPQGQGMAQVRLVPGGIKYRFTVKDVRTAADAPADGVVFRGRLHLRMTDHGCSGAPSCTVETFLTADLPCNAGSCAASLFHADELFVAGLGGAVEVTRIDVLDDAGNRFATQGLLLH